MTSPRMTLDDVLTDMRAHGMKMGKELLTRCLEENVFPFSKNVVLEGGHNNFIIMRKDYNDWADVYLHGNNEN